MSKLTWFFGVLVAGLGVAVGFIWWQLAHYNPGEGDSSGEVAALELGVAGGGNNDDWLFQSASAVLWDIEKGVMRYEQNAFERRPIASITKLMTAMVALDYGMPWEQEMTINRNEYGLGGNLLLHPGEAVSMRDLFYASIVGSANNATLAYVRGLGFEENEFVREMNRKAVALGLEQTEFADVTGLNDRNVSTAYEVARLAEYAFANYPELARAASTADYAFTVRGSGREHAIRHTNKLISQEGLETLGSKTGYLDAAKWCLVMQGAGEMKNRIGIILGNPSEQGQFREMRELLDLPVF